MILPRQLKPRDVLQWLVRTPNPGCAHVCARKTRSDAAATLQNLTSTSSPRKRMRWTRNSRSRPPRAACSSCLSDDDDVYYYIRWRLKLEGETENMGVCTKEWKGVTAAVLMATPCTNSLGGESGGQRHEGCGGRSACWKFAAVSGSGAGGRRC